ncbi:uncharacterized protein PG986_007978 [Apiospora aurea]|uniref:RING-type domain-containing protein n=1 Tax=Apiospora aurea TaxID=335848 RepID=A0ABR1QE50_9PEZI
MASSSSSSTRHRRGHAPKDSGISTGTAKPELGPEPELDAAPTRPPSSSSKEDFFICDRCEQPRALYRRLPYRNTELFVCDYCFQPITMKDPRDASIVFEMKWCRQGNHEAPAINFRDVDNMGCYHCAKRRDSYPPMHLPEPPLRVRPDLESDSRRGKGAATTTAAAAPGDETTMQQDRNDQLHYAATQQRREERPQIQYYSGSYKLRGHFENSSRPPKILPIYHPQVRPPNMGKYTTNPRPSAPLQRLDPNTESKARARPQPQAQPKKPAVHGSRTYHEVPNPNQGTPPRTGQRPPTAGRHEPLPITHDQILKSIPLSQPSKSVSVNRTPKAKAQAQAHQHHKPQQQKHPQQKRQQQNQRPRPQSPIAIRPLVPSWEFDALYNHRRLPQQDLPQQQKWPPQPPQPPKRPRPKTQYDKPPAAPSWELKTLRAQEQRRKQQEQQDRIDALCRVYQPRPPASKTATTEQQNQNPDQGRADSDVLGPQETCPACGKHRPTHSELIEAYGFCFHCLRRHLVAAGELLKCPSCRRLQARQDFMTYDSDGLIVRPRTEVCMSCRWRQRNGAKKLGAALCGAAGGLV